MVWLITTILRPNNRPCSGGTHVLHGWRNSRPKSHQERSWPLFWFFFWNMGGIFVSDCLLKGQIVLAEFYSNLLCWLKNKFKKKKKSVKPQKCVLFCLQDNAPAHKTSDILKNFGFQPPYSPGLALSTSCFPTLKRVWKGVNFQRCWQQQSSISVIIYQLLFWMGLMYQARWTLEWRHGITTHNSRSFKS